MASVKVSYPKNLSMILIVGYAGERIVIYCRVCQELQPPPPVLRQHPLRLGVEDDHAPPMAPLEISQGCSSPGEIGISSSANGYTQEVALVDVGMSGGSFIWSNMKAEATFSRLDIFLNFVDWEDHFSYAQDFMEVVTRAWNEVAMGPSNYGHFGEEVETHSWKAGSESGSRSTRLNPILDRIGSQDPMDPREVNKGILTTLPEEDPEGGYGPRDQSFAGNELFSSWLCVRPTFRRHLMQLETTQFQNLLSSSPPRTFLTRRTVGFGNGRKR
ncbi:hypothetical protein Taro_013182, partial [Colocasia esculenta]|nr:hypothetical protein [Colocasia esculenta]